MGTGTGTLMPIIPTWTPRWNRGRPRRWVKIAVPLPYGLALIEVDRLVDGVGADHGEDRAEDLLAVDVHVGL